MSRVTCKELEALIYHLNLTKGHFLEVGTLHGGTAKRIATKNPCRTVVTIDHRIYENMQKTTHDFVLAADFPQNVIRIIGDSYHVGRNLHGIFGTVLGVVFIDGDHRYPIVKQDACVYSQYLMWRGRLAFHDSEGEGLQALDGFNDIKQHKGVAMVISELLASGNWTSIDVVDSITFLQRKLDTETPAIRREK